MYLVSSFLFPSVSLVHLSGDSPGAQFWALYLLSRLHTWTHSSVCFIVPVVCSSVFRGGSADVTIWLHWAKITDLARAGSNACTCWFPVELWGSITQPSAAIPVVQAEIIESGVSHWSITGVWKEIGIVMQALLLLKYLNVKLFFSPSFWSV